MSNFFNEAYKRIKCETPKFFKRLRITGNSLMATGTSCLAAQIVPNLKMPPVLTELGGHAIVAGFVMTLVASFAVNDPNDIHKQ